MRAERLLHEAAREAGVDLHTIADELIYVPGADAPFWVVQNGKKILDLNNASVFATDETRRLLIAMHEVNHARVHAGLARGLSYEAEEVFVESLARQTLQGKLSPRAFRDSIIYENFYRRLIGLPELTVPPLS